MKTTKNTSLPFIQSQFMQSFDGTIESALRFNELAKVLNPVFSAHYFYVSGETDEDTVTTRSTDGSFAYHGKQTSEQMENAYSLAAELKELFLNAGLKRLDSFSMDLEFLRSFGKIDRVRKRGALLINGNVTLIPGIVLN